MKVFGYATDKPEEWTTPFPKGWIGAKARLMAGDVLDPVDFGVVMRPGREGEVPNWFNSLPAKVFLGHVDTPRLPFFSFGLFRFGFYVGYKVFGVDSPAYLDYPGVKPEDVYVGSQAMCPTIRFTFAREWGNEP